MQQVRRKITQIRQRIAEKNARALEAEHERARLIEEKRQIEHRRMQEWIGLRFVSELLIAYRRCKDCV